MSYYLFLVTVPNLEEGRKIGTFLVKNKIAACVNVIKDIFSIFEWKGNLEEDNEHLLLIKTTEEKCELLIQKINEIHSYDTPECIGFKIEKGSEKYLNWIKEIVG
ncbi:MAG: divalent-cation tolerance protein CutA [Promethearchaeota archaeon]